MPHWTFILQPNGLIAFNFTHNISKVNFQIHALGESIFQTRILRIKIQMEVY